MSFKASGPKSRPDRVKSVPSPTPATPSAKLHSPFSSRRSSTSSTESFHSARNDPNDQDDDTPRDALKPLRFSPSQEALHVSASNDLKSQANTQFSHGDYSSALGTYDRAISELPVYLDYELAVLQSNIAACHIRLNEWRDTVKAAEKGWESLENIDPTPKPKPDSRKETKDDQHDNTDDSDAVIELPDDNTDAANEALLHNLDLSAQRKADIHRIRTKLLLRRARGRYMLGTTPPPPPPPTSATNPSDKNPFSQASQLTSDTGTSTSAWSNLSSALTDYQLLSTPAYFTTLPASDQRTVREALATLPSLAEKAKETEVAEMMGKLKELGNGILRPFGLSTDMFKMDKDPNTGGMSLRFDGQAGKK